MRRFGRAAFVTSEPIWVSGKRRSNNARRRVAANPADNGSLADLAAAYAWAGHDKEAKETAAELYARDPKFIQGIHTYMDAHDDPTYKEEMARLFEGLRKAGLPEGEKTTNLTGKVDAFVTRLPFVARPTEMTVVLLLVKFIRHRHRVPRRG